MAINFRTTKKVDSARDYKLIAAHLEKLNSSLPTLHSQIRIVGSKCVLAKRTMTYVDRLGTSENITRDGQLQAVIETMKKSQPNCTLHDVYCGLENVLTDYSKKLTTFAQTMVTTVREYSVGLFDLFCKKLRVNQKIDVSKFVGLDTSMRMIVMTYGDYCEIGHPIVEKSANVVKDVADFLPSLGRVRVALKNKDNDDLKKRMEELTGKINNGVLISFLKDHKLVDFQFGQDFNNGAEGLIKIDPSERFKELEVSRVLAEAGWDDIDKLKDSLILQNSEAISKNISSLYKLSMDLMDEVRRISGEYCVAEPYICAALVKYGSLVAQMVNVYTKAFDMCWTTCLRVSQAGFVESN